MDVQNIKTKLNTWLDFAVFVLRVSMLTLLFKFVPVIKFQWSSGLHLFCDLYFSKNTFPKIQQKLGGQLEICISACLLSATLLNGWTETLYSCSIRPEDVHEGGPNNFKGGIQYCGTFFFLRFYFLQS